MSRPIICLDTHELAWAAGFFDGEGSVLWRGKKRKEICVSIAQSELQPLERFYEAIGKIGSLRGPYYHRVAHHKPYWVVYVNGFPNTQAVIALLWRWLSEPKRSQADTALLAAAPYYRKRYLSGAGRAHLTLAQAKKLRLEHAAARAGRQRVPHGWIKEAAVKYGIKPDTVASICQGYGYNGDKTRRIAA